ncbi:type II secretion system F family protein [Actinophytocola sp.]|uniref:type II secretion system F family protein n=1 Tax=Actinophytocola sp. TaxID=1872138 RepID=UPI002D3A8E24|nr:type II secretion system F family protein [Actinophytocola sp.]HYQ61887.1 type II secretion system F family protein [Actinophytocola sp.]
MNLSIALVLLAAAVPLWSGAGTPRLRLAGLNGRPAPGTRLRRRLAGRRPSGTPPARLFAAVAGVLTAVVVGGPGGAVAGAMAAAAVWWFLRRARRPPRADPMTVAAAWDLLSACLRAGLPVPTAVTAVAGELPAEASRALKESADLLALGAAPDAAWAPATSCPDTAALARGARRAAQSGTALAELAAELAADVRANVVDAAEAKAQRASVLITAPLGLCFLPAFVCLGLVPVIAGLARQIAL